MVPSKAKADARCLPGREGDRLGHLTVPALLHTPERHATKNAVQIAGLNVLLIINAPTAALAGLPAGQEGERYHFGRSTWAAHFLDVSILDVGDGVFPVQATTATPPGRDD